MDMWNLAEALRNQLAFQIFVWRWKMKFDSR